MGLSGSCCTKAMNLSRRFKCDCIDVFVYDAQVHSAQQPSALVYLSPGPVLVILDFGPCSGIPTR